MSPWLSSLLISSVCLASSSLAAALPSSGSVFYSVQSTEFVWQAPSPKGKPLHLSDESHSHIDSLPFPFPFFGEPHSDLFVSSNGAVVFHPTEGVSQHSYQAVERFPSASSDALKDLVAGLWDDLKPSAATDSDSKGDVYYEAFEDRVVVTYERMEYWLSQKQPNTFQIILHRTGDIVIQYLTGSRNPSTKVGLQNEDGTVGANFDDEILPNSAIRFSPVDNCADSPSQDECLAEHREPCTALSPVSQCGECVRPYSLDETSATCQLHCGEVSEDLCASLSREPCSVTTTVKNTCGSCLEGMWAPQGSMSKCEEHCPADLNCDVLHRLPCDSQTTQPNSCGLCAEGFYELANGECAPQEQFCEEAPSKLHCFDLNRRACSFGSSLNQNECGSCMAGYSAVSDTDEELAFPFEAETACFRSAPTYAFKTTEFAWTPLSEEPNAHKLILEDDSNQIVDLPFKFPFHQELKRKVSVSSNGMLTFGTQDMQRISAYSHSPRSIPDWRAPNDFIAPLWDDLNPDVDGASVLYLAEADRFVVEFSKVPYASGAVADDSFSFQVVLAPSGEIQFHYLQIPEGNIDWTTVVGVEDQLGELGASLKAREIVSRSSWKIVPAPDLESLRGQLAVAREWHAAGPSMYQKNDLNKLFLNIRDVEEKLGSGNIVSSRQLSDSLHLFQHPLNTAYNHPCEGFWTPVEDSICSPSCLKSSFWNQTAEQSGNGTCEFIHGEIGQQIPCTGGLCPTPPDVRIQAKHAWPETDTTFPYPTPATAAREATLWDFRLPNDILTNTNQGRVNTFLMHSNGFVIYSSAGSSTRRRRLLQVGSIHQIYYFFDVRADQSDPTQATPLEIFDQLEKQVDDVVGGVPNTTMATFYPYIYEVLLFEVPPPAVDNLTPALNTEVPSGFQAFQIQFSSIVEFGSVAQDDVLIRIRRFGAYVVAEFTKSDIILQTVTNSFTVANFYAPPNVIIQDTNFVTQYEVLVIHPQAFVVPNTNTGLDLGFSWVFSIVCPPEVSPCVPIVSSAQVDLTLLDAGVVQTLQDADLEAKLKQELSQALSYSPDFLEVSVITRTGGEVDVQVTIHYDASDGRTPAEVAAELTALFNDRACPLCQYDILQQLQSIDWKLFPEIPRPVPTATPTNPPEDGFPWWGILLIVLSILIVCGGVYFLYLQRQKTIERDGNLDPFTVEDDELEPTTADDDDDWGDEPPIMSADSEPVVVDLGNI